MIFRNISTMARTLDAQKGDLNVDFASDRPWTNQAICHETDPESFFPRKGGSTRAALRICQGCPVREECLEWALEAGEEWGIWGGVTERERRRLRRLRKLAKAQAAGPVPVAETAA